MVLFVQVAVVTWPRVILTTNVPDNSPILAVRCVAHLKCIRAAIYSVPSLPSILLYIRIAKDPCQQRRRLSP